MWYVQCVVPAGRWLLRARNDRVHAAASSGRDECGEARGRGDGREARRGDRLRHSIRGLLLSGTYVSLDLNASCPVETGLTSNCDIC